MRKSKYSICLLLSAALCAGMFYGCSHGGATSSDGDSGGGETSEQQALVGKYSTVWTLSLIHILKHIRILPFVMYCLRVLLFCK